MTDIEIAPSLLAADQADLRSSVELLQDHVDAFHVDVMDGHFVPNISMGPAVVAGIRPLTALVLDVHLMVANPDVWISPYREAGADWISVHAEATVHLEGTMSQIRELGARAGVALNPATPFSGLQYVLREGDFVLVMSVNPGYGGQRFLPASVAKIAQLRAFLDAAGLTGVDIQVDGGVGEDNAADCCAAGARLLVAGSSIIKSADPVAAVASIRRRGAGAAHATSPTGG